MNLQNLPATNNFRNCFKASPDHVLIDGDYSGQEARIAAEGSKDPVWIDALVSNKDLHSEVASTVFKVPLEQVRDKQERFKGKSYRDIAKTINFALIFGASKYRLSSVLGITTDEAEQIIKDYFIAIPKLKTYLHACAEYGLKNGYIRSYAPFKAMRHLNGWYDGIATSTDRSDSAMIESIKRDCYNTPIQASASMMLKLAMILFNFNKNNSIASNSKIVLTVHDQILVDCYNRDDVILETRTLLNDAMLASAYTVLKTVPMVIDIKVTPHWDK